MLSGLTKHECSILHVTSSRRLLTPVVRSVRGPLLPSRKGGWEVSDLPSSRPHSYLRVPSLSSTVPQAPSICTRVLSARLPCFHVTQAELETPQFFMRLLILASSLGRMGKCGMLLSGLWLRSICRCLPEVRDSGLISSLNNKFPMFYSSTKKQTFKKSPVEVVKCTRNLGVLSCIKNP